LADHGGWKRSRMLKSRKAFREAAPLIGFIRSEPTATV
jgi:hypothetical protein